MQKIDGPFRLIHMDGRIRICPTVEDVAESICNGYSWTRIDEIIDHCLVGDRPFHRSQSASPHREVFENAFNRHRWIVRDEYDLIVPLNWLRKAFRIAQDRARKLWFHRWRVSPRDAISTDWSVFRGRTVEGSGSGGGWRQYHRHGFRTTQERREQQRIIEELFEYDIIVSPRRTLPSSWDDLHRSDAGIKNWKRFRRTQYRT